MSEPPVQAHLLISGRVQGVNFRYYTARQAQGLGLKGWVRNLTDGRVEVRVEGPEKDVEALVGWCRHGPSAAHVTQLEETREAPTGRHLDFRVRSTVSLTG